MISEKRADFDFSRRFFLGGWGGLGTILGPLSTPHVHSCVHPGYALPSQNQSPLLAAPCSAKSPARPDLEPFKSPKDAQKWYSENRNSHAVEARRCFLMFRAFFLCTPKTMDLCALPKDSQCRKAPKKESHTPNAIHGPLPLPQTLTLY